jgi:two-component system alkaline phosphatase synthesis response regulator PhoP
MKGKIMVVDDEEALVKLITHNLEKEGFATLAAYEGSEVQKLIVQGKPDLIIMDIRLPGKDGLEICRDLRRKKIKTPIIILTARDTEGDRILGLEAGADDYITKPFSVPELTARVKAVLRRKTDQMEPTDDEVDIVAGHFVIKPQRYEICFNSRRLDLTLKEYQLLELLIKNKGRVLKRDYLWQALWDYSNSLNSRIINVHICRLREKTEKDSGNPQYIKTVRGLGYKFEEK